MIKDTISRSLLLPGRHSTVNIRLAFTLEFLKPEDVSLEIRVASSLTQSDSLKSLWSEIREGVNTAVWKVEQMLTTASVKVTIEELQVSESLDSLTSQEIKLVGEEIKSMLQETLSLRLSENWNQ